MPTYKLSPEQILKLNRMKHLNLNPAYGGDLIMPDESSRGEAALKAIVKTNGMEIKITTAEAFKL